MTVQILQYEFLGPVAFSEWGPPMGNLVYLVMSRSRDRFHILYVGDCEQTDRADYLTSNEQFKCWIKAAAGEANLYLAVLPLPEAGPHGRKRIVDRIVSRYAPPCNVAGRA